MSHANLVTQAACQADTSCSACGLAMRPFFELPGVPVNSCLLVESREKALEFPRGDIVLAVCPDCGFVRNIAFEPNLTEYSGRYEETQGFSATFTRFQESLAAELVARHQVQRKTVIEVGCGKGEFLALLCRLGGNRGIGYDPSFDAARGIIDDDLDVQVIRERYGEGSGRGDGDLVCCKMTLEHIQRAAPFAQAIRSALRPASQSTLFIQVPESLRILQDCAFEDVYYEHCSYFTPGSLARLFRSAGLQVERLAVTYGNQYLTLEGRLKEPADGPDHTLPEEETADAVVQLAAQFASRFEENVADWRQRVEDAARLGPVALWGSGSKAVAFLRAIQPVAAAIEHIVDINPHRHGFYMPGTGQRILSPSELAIVAPRTVIAMNPIYRSEIATDLRRLGIAAELLTL